jgi:hypothetical protein
VTEEEGGKRGGAHGVVVQEEGEAALGRRDEEEEGRVAAWAERPNGSAGRVAQEVEWAGWPHGPGGRMGRLAAGLKVEEKFFLNKNLIFDYSKALEICRRGFKRNFDMWIFPKFF